MADYGPVGGSGGKPFDVQEPGPSYEIGMLIIWGTKFIDSIQVIYRDPTNGDLQASNRYGGTGGDPHIIALQAGEYIEQISGRTGEVVDRLRIVTSKSKEYAVGGTGGEKEFFLPPLTGSVKVTGFIGKCGQFIDAIGIHSQNV